MLKKRFKYILCVFLSVWVGTLAFAETTASTDAYSAYLLKGPDMRQIDMRGKHTLLVCAANLKYYLVNHFGEGYGPDNQWEHDIQRIKTNKAFALINADIYGLCEIQRGTAALKEICTDLNNAHSDRNYQRVDNQTTEDGTYTMSAYIYDANKVMPVGDCKVVSSGVKNRKYMQLFVEKASGEGFIFSMNHFQSKVSAGDDQRAREASAVNSTYNTYKLDCNEEDLLIMGDLNAYPGEPAITTLLDGEVISRTDLHTYFHADSSYSYYYNGYDYLDHAIANATMLPQVTGMQAFHCNSRYTDRQYGYPSGNESIFRYSDHDPILVGLRLDDSPADLFTVFNYGPNIRVTNADGGYIRVYDMSGNLLYHRALKTQSDVISQEEIPQLQRGYYILHVFHDGKNDVRKYLHL